MSKVFISLITFIATSSTAASSEISSRYHYGDAAQASAVVNQYRLDNLTTGSNEPDHDTMQPGTASPHYMYGNPRRMPRPTMGINATPISSRYFFGDAGR